MNNFYNPPKIVQWIMALMLLILGFLPALFIIEQGEAQSIFYLLFIIYVPIGQFAFTPFFRLIGVYTYYSPMLLGYMANDKQIDLHSGGSFDYLVVMKKFRPGLEMRNKLLMFHLEGLMHIIQSIENKNIPESVNIIGTSYFFNERTLNKMGFELETPSLFYRINLFLNFIDLIWMYSLSKGKLAIPRLWSAKKASISGNRLLANKVQLTQLYDKMNARI